jgi:hypothetical protein
MFVLRTPWPVILIYNIYTYIAVYKKILVKQINGEKCYKMNFVLLNFIYL